MAYYHLFWDDTKQEPHIVKQGFNFFAFLFGAFYFLYKKAFISAGAFFAASVALSAINLFFELPEAIWVCISMAFNVYVGFDASDCLYGDYCKSGYRYLKSDFYASKDQAIADIFTKKSL
jgi:hypothetical protein